MQIKIVRRIANMLGVIFIAALVLPVNAVEPGTIAVRVSGIKYAEGNTLDLMIYGSAEAQENDKPTAKIHQKLEEGAEQTTFVLENIPAGEYMIVGAQDANGNGELDTNFIGIPKEGYFTSKNKRLPSWDKCSFYFDGDAEGIELKMIYW